MTDSKAHASHGKGLIDHPNFAAEDISYFTPAQLPPAGSALDPQTDGKKIPLLFKPLKLRGMAMQNRIMVSPLCQYSATNGHLTDWHLTHIGGIVQRGPGLTLVEATAVQKHGRITPEDSGLWLDSQIEPLRRIVEFAHSQGQNIGIQLAHAGRKASTVAPWIVRKGTATEAIGGWPDKVYGPTNERYDENSPIPKAMTIADIEQLKLDWVSAVKRALKAGFDTIEIHMAHGYLLHSFYSPACNTRTDEYGGSFENRIRLPLELVKLTRAAIPDSMPLLVRMTGTDWLEHEPSIPSWTVTDAVNFAKALADTGAVDMLDVSTSGISDKQQIKTGPSYQAPFSQAVKKAVEGRGIAVGVVGSITEGKQAQGLLEDGVADIAVVGRGFQKNPGLVWQFAEDLDIGLELRQANQIGWGFGQGENAKAVTVTNEHKGTDSANKRRP